MSGLTAEPALAAAARVASRHSFRPQCLERVLAGRWMLARLGHGPMIVIGATQPPLDAHAWLEIGGRVAVGGAHARRLEPLWLCHSTGSSRRSEP